MSEPDVEAVIKAASARRKTKTAPTAIDPEPVTLVVDDSPVSALERLGLAADAASRAVAAFKRMWT
jgi:hypothetical protein